MRGTHQFDPRGGWDRSPFPELYESEPSTPLCAALADGDREADLVIVHHLHGVGLPFVRALADAYRIRTVVGIPYSAVGGVVERLRREFDFEVVVPDDTAAIPDVVRRAIAADPRPVIVSEIGGYTSEIAGLLDDAPNVRGVVEDTNQGHWRWEAADLDSLPVLSIAQSELKRVESGVVAKSIVDGTARFLAAHGLPGLSERRVHVRGYGNVGRPTARYLDDVAAEVTVHDTDPVRRLRAAADHRTTPDPGDADLVLGVTGNPEGSVTAADVPTLGPETLLVSGSSRQVEFDLDGFASRAVRVERGSAIREYAFDGPDGRRTVRVANEGEPINLRYSEVPSRTLDLVYGGLVRCINRIDDGDADPGLHPIPAADQRGVADRHLGIYGGSRA